jgi:hypothetical protein
MFSHDAGHTHGPTPYFVTDCPLCDAAKEARNQAIAHLAEALYLFNGLGPDGELPTLRLNVSPIGITGDDTRHCHSFDITAKQAEHLADGIESDHAYAGSRSMPSDAADFAREHPYIAGLISDTFEEIFTETDPRVFLDDVLTSDRPGQAAEAYEDLLGGETDGTA